MSELVCIDFACNDPDNGALAGRVAQISVAGGALELTAKGWSLLSFRGCPKIREDGSKIVLAGKPWTWVRSKSWVGNWCWEGYAFEPETATAFLVWLHWRGLFKCEGGWVELCEAWDGPARLALPEQWWKP